MVLMILFLIAGFLAYKMAEQREKDLDAQRHDMEMKDAKLDFEIARFLGDEELARAQMTTARRARRAQTVSSRPSRAYGTASQAASAASQAPVSAAPAADSDSPAEPFEAPLVEPLRLTRPVPVESVVEMEDESEESTSYVRPDREICVPISKEVKCVVSFIPEIDCALRHLVFTGSMRAMFGDRLVLDRITDVSEMSEIDLIKTSKMLGAMWVKELMKERSEEFGRSGRKAGKRKGRRNAA